MKIKGNMKKASAFTPDLFPKPTPENFAKYGAATPTTAATTKPATPNAEKITATAGGDLKTDRIFQMMNLYLSRGEGKTSSRSSMLSSALISTRRRARPQSETGLLT